MEWLKETVNMAGFKRYEPPQQIIYDPWEIRMKYPQVGFLLDVLTIFNAVVSIIAFILKQLTLSNQKEFKLHNDKIKEDKFTTGSLATMLPEFYPVQKVSTLTRPVSYVLNTCTDVMQIKHLIIIGFCLVGLVRQDTTYPYLLLFLIVSELEVMQKFIWVIYCRTRGLLMISSLACTMIFSAAYYRFISRQCLEVSECFTDLIRGIVDLPNTGWTEFSLFMVSVVLLFNLFLGLIIDSISEIRAKNQAIEEQLNSRCFVCDLSQQDFELANLDFKKHVSEEHNPIAYLFYMMWVSDQPMDASSTKITREVKANIQEQQVSFMPWRKCLSVEEDQKAK